MSTDNPLFQLILKGDTETIRKLYHECFPTIKQLVLKNSGQLEDAEDIFQEAMIVLYRMIKEDRLMLSCTLSTFIYSICRNMWLDRLRRQGREVGIIDGSHDIIDLDNNIIEVMHLNERYTLYQKHFQNIGASCQKLLTLFFEGKTMKFITQAMGFGSEQYTRKRKFMCKEKLVNSIKVDPLFNELDQGNTLKIYTIK